jgi:hypothetical protein
VLTRKRKKKKEFKDEARGLRFQPSMRNVHLEGERCDGEKERE